MNECKLPPGEREQINLTSQKPASHSTQERHCRCTLIGSQSSCSVFDVGGELIRERSKFGPRHRNLVKPESAVADFDAGEVKVEDDFSVRQERRSQHAGCSEKLLALLKVAAVDLMVGPVLCLTRAVTINTPGRVAWAVLGRAFATGTPHCCGFVAYSAFCGDVPCHVAGNVGEGVLAVSR